MLTEWGMNIAEMAGLPVYLESSPTAFPLYQKLGFQKIDSVVHRPEVTGEDSDIEVPIMVKMPSCAGNLTFTEWVAKGYPSLRK
jgi:hypothetical protein